MIDEFRGEYFFLSNFSPHAVTYNGKIFDTVEHIYQAAKTYDKEWQDKIRLADKPGKAKRYGGKAPLREDWEDVKVNIMKHVVFLKFTQNIKIGKQLLQTGDRILVEGNYWHDNFWGNCSCPRCQTIEGENTLGRLLMYTRSII